MNDFHSRFYIHEKYLEETITRMRQLGYNAFSLGLNLAKEARQKLATYFYTDTISMFLRYLPDAYLETNHNLYFFDIKTAMLGHTNIAIECAALTQYKRIAQLTGPRRLFIVIPEKACWLEDLIIKKQLSASSTTFGSKRQCSIIDMKETAFHPLDIFLSLLY